MENGKTSAFARPHSVDDGGDFKEHQFASEGLTKREYFAGLAMQGILANSNNRKQSDFTHIDFAYMAVKQADELLKQLNPHT